MVNSEILDLKLDPLMLGRDAGDPVDVSLQQAHSALKVQYFVIKKLQQILMKIIAKK